ncbi:MAG: LURP-one-related family protein, partial [Gemmatimonadales bacterium]
MQYLMQQKLLSWGDDFTIRDASGADHYFVDGKAISLGKQLSFKDMSGHELAFIKQKLLAWGPTYELYRDGAIAAVVKKELFTLFHCVFTVDVPGPDDLTAEGTFTDHEYTFTRGGRIVATVSKQWFAFRDTYGVDIDSSEDAVLILASTVIIDMACHPDGRH